MANFRCMESFPDPGAELPMRVVSAGSPAVLLDIFQPKIGLAVWGREPDATWVDDAVALGRGDHDTRRIETLSSDVARLLARQFHTDFPDWLTRDVGWLACLLSAMAKSPRLIASFGGVPTGTRLPHNLRLFCCYGGKPVPWLYFDGNGSIMPGGMVDPFAVVILKGAYRPSLRDRAIWLDPDAISHGGPILVLEPAFLL